MFSSPGSPPSLFHDKEFGWGGKGDTRQGVKTKKTGHVPLLPRSQHPHPPPPNYSWILLFMLWHPPSPFLLFHVLSIQSSQVGGGYIIPSMAPFSVYAIQTTTATRLPFIAHWTNIYATQTPTPFNRSPNYGKQQEWLQSFSPIGIDIYIYWLTVNFTPDIGVWIMQ